MQALAAISRAAMDGVLEGRAALAVSIAKESGVLLGAFQRKCDAPSALYRRVSGGSALVITPGTIHVALALRSPDALTPCDETRILNRYVRPLLRALTKSGALAHYFGRDWVSVDHRPVAFVGFAHDSATRRTAFEAFVATGSPLWEHTRASLLGKEPSRVDVDPEKLARAITEAYRGAYGALDELVARDAAEPVTDDPPWAATEEAAIGVICAGPDARGAMRVGGELMASRNAIAALEKRLAAGEMAIDETLGKPGVALFGIKSLQSIRDVIQRAIATT